MNNKIERHKPKIFSKLLSKSKHKRNKTPMTGKLNLPGGYFDTRTQAWVRTIN
jgi:hypothetical protein